MSLFSRSFDQAAIERFAVLSGDTNPIHTDPVAARRLLFGTTVCHGVGLVLWALECLATQLNSSVRLSRVAADFRAPVLVDEDVELALDIGEGEAKAMITGARGLRTSINIAWDMSLEDGPAVSRLPEPVPCEAKTFAQAEHDESCLSLWLDDTSLEDLAPQVARLMQHRQIALLVATTRLIGMECPGLNSIYLAMKLSFEPATGPVNAVAYRVSSANERFARLGLSVTSADFSGELSASVRPLPYSQMDLAAVQNRVPVDWLKDERAIVIGGSRGLGELINKILIAGGAPVRASFNQGEVEAKLMASEIRKTRPDADIDVFQLDVSGEYLGNLADQLEDFAPTQVYFFASPRVILDGGDQFDNARYDNYCRYYVDGMTNVIRQLAKTPFSPLPIFLPSTSFIDKPPRGAAEYVSAKLASEQALVALQKELEIVPVIVRLPPLATDQTMTLLGHSGIDGFDPMLAVVKQVTDVSIGRRS
ncbi:MAG: hypothetical protein HQ495_03905 [Alphaproteobacteria bacterium]|nr:hypothetical protein [Alphaproteobacteria bacterium]